MTASLNFWSRLYVRNCFAQETIFFACVMSFSTSAEIEVVKAVLSNVVGDAEAVLTKRRSGPNKRHLDTEDIYLCRPTMCQRLLL